MDEDTKILERHGVARPPPEIQAVLIDHFIREKAICNKIRNTDRRSAERTELFKEVYTIAHEATKKYIDTGFLTPDVSFKENLCRLANKLFKKPGSMLELGCGKGYLLRAMDKLGWKCKGVDIDTSGALDEVKDKIQQADIVSFRDIRKYDLIIVDQVLEHIPKQDCHYFLGNVYSMLKRGGFLVSCTPNRLNGPHDVSRWFLPLGAVAEGTHFNEMTLEETISAMKSCGFLNFKIPSFPVPQKVPSRLDFMLFWTENYIPPSIMFEKLYPLIPNPLKPSRTFTVFVSNILAAQKLNL
jgi:2-polyprenyl-3-methyl-5-hydroxy-6-metoxy-1,4-benzoquinol methylase